MVCSPPPLRVPAGEVTGLSPFRKSCQKDFYYYIKSINCY